MIAVKVRMMPSSQKTNLEKVKEEAEKIVKKFGATLHSWEKEEIAFGLKALILTIVWPEEKSPSLLEEELAKIKNINSAEIVDARRISLA